MVKRLAEVALCQALALALATVATAQNIPLPPLPVRAPVLCLKRTAGYVSSFQQAACCLRSTITTHWSHTSTKRRCASTIWATMPPTPKN